jgi:hypothetical protein
MRSRISKKVKALVEQHKQRLKESEERAKKGLAVVKEKILTKRGLFRIRKPVRDFLAENWLIPTSKESIGRGWGIPTGVLGHYEEVFEKILFYTVVI